MFRVSQEIRLNTGANGSESIRGSSAATANNNSIFYSDSNKIFGRYQKTPDTDSYAVPDHHVFVAPELTDASKVQIQHFPNGAVRIQSDVSFVLKRNGVKGNFEVKLEKPSGETTVIPLKALDRERTEVNFKLNQAGLYKVHIKCNSVVLPKSPFILICIRGYAEAEAARIDLPVFTSDASKVTHRGLGLSHIYLNEKNEFTVDASEAGSNIFFVGLFGPRGQCDEVAIKHMGRNIYRVSYKIQDPGDYILAAKWGDEHIPGSPFILKAL